MEKEMASIPLGGKPQLIALMALLIDICRETTDNEIIFATQNQEGKKLYLNIKLSEAN